MPLLPGGNAWENYMTVNFGRTLARRNPAHRRHAVDSFIMAMAITIGKLSISILSAFGDRLFPLPFRMFFFWIIFLTLNAAWSRCASCPPSRWLRISACSTASRGLSDPADRLGHRDLPVPAVLHDRAGRADGSRARRWRRSDERSSRTSAAAVGDQHRGAVCHHLFIYGWNQYLWPLLITTDTSYYTMSWASSAWSRAAIPSRCGTSSWPPWFWPRWPPVLVILFMQRLFVKGLTETEK